MPDLFFKKALGGLVPTTEDGKEWLAKLPMGEILRGKFSRPRNGKHHAKYWAMLGLVASNTERLTSDEIHRVIKYRCGIGRIIQTKTGPFWLEGSISFAKMNQDQFEEFYQRAVGFVCDEIIPGLDNADLERELQGFAA